MADPGIKAIQFIAITISLVSSVATICLIVFNRMWSRLYPLLLFIVSTSSLLFSVVALLEAINLEITPTNCKIEAGLFYFFWMVRSIRFR